MITGALYSCIVFAENHQQCKYIGSDLEREHGTSAENSNASVIALAGLILNST